MTAREIFRRCPQVKKQLWGGEFWTDGFFASTVGKHGDEAMIGKTEGAEILPAYYEALRIIRDCNPKSQAEIAKALCISASAVSQQLSAARGKGLLEQGKLQLTKKGKAEIDKFFVDHSTDL